MAACEFELFIVFVGILLFGWLYSVPSTLLKLLMACESGFGCAGMWMGWLRNASMSLGYWCDIFFC